MQRTQINSTDYPIGTKVLLSRSSVTGPHNAVREGEILGWSSNKFELVLTNRPIDRFMKFVNTNSGECWMWLGGWYKSKGKNTYGRFTIKSIGIGAHVASYLMFNGEIKNNLWVLHTCDNTKCVNPKHLFLGTPKDNMQDCVKKGRFPSNEQWADIRSLRANPWLGENCSWAKLTNVQIKDIKLRKENGDSQASIARSLGINQSTVSRILSNKRRSGIIQRRVSIRQE